MMLAPISAGLVVILWISEHAAAVDQDANPLLVAQLKAANTRLDQQKLLKDSDYKYDFSRNPLYSWNPGSVCNANIATFPALTGIEMTVAQLNLGACSMLPPHYHRADNLVVAVSGETVTYMMQENGARMIKQILTPGTMTIFPRASMHSMFNNGCTNNQLYSFLDMNDPATVNVLNNLWLFGPDIVTAIAPFLSSDDNSWNSTGRELPPIGTGSNSYTQECMKRCGLSQPGNSSTSRVIH